MSRYSPLKPLKAGYRTHSLVVIGPTGEKSKDGSILYNCKCDCGNEVIYQRSNLNGSRRKSCGCRQTTSQQKPPGEVSFKVLYGSYRSRAKKENYVFELTLDQFKELVTKNCTYCGLPPVSYNTYVTDGNKSKAIQSPSVKRAWIKANGVDQKIPKAGYTIENSVTCCAQCNYAKSDYTEQEFIEHNKRMYNFQKAKNVD